MPRRFSLPTLIILLACTLLTALLPLFAASLSASHDQRVNLQAQSVRHLALADAEHGAHQHQHEDDSMDASPSEQQHGHSAADHIHETQFVPPEHALTLAENSPQWNLRSGLVGTSADLTLPERPPKPTTA